MKKVLLTVSIIVFSITAFLACNKDEVKVLDNSKAPTETEKSSVVNAEYLGKLLFFDPILSGNKDVACATCHHPNFAFADGLDLSIGVNAVGLGPKRQFLSSAFPPTKRKSMTILNTAFNGMDEKGNFDPTNAPMFWDSRAKSLEEQALIPIQSSVEMRANAYPESLAIDSVVTRLKNIPEYLSLFKTVFGGDNPITSSNLAKAIASFERSLTNMNSPYDRYLRGEVDALSDLEKRGLNAFQTDGCPKCHSGVMFSDYKLHTLSVPDNPKNNESDIGANGAHAFRTMSLRNVKLTGPYMHSGVFKTLEEVIDFYNEIQKEKSQNPKVPNSKIDSLTRFLRPVGQKAEIIAFLGALTGEYEFTLPKSVPSKLQVGGSIR
jgi:cytochrome c peroxidase